MFLKISQISQESRTTASIITIVLIFSKILLSSVANYRIRVYFTITIFYKARVKVNESWCKHCEVTTYLCAGQKLFEKISRKVKSWHNQLRQGFSTRQNLLKKNIKKKVLTQSIEKSFLIDLLSQIMQYTVTR